MVEIRQIAGALGAELHGLDLSQLDDVGAAALRAALDQHLAVYLPDQSLDRFQLSALGRCFGPPFLHPIVDNGFDDCPEVLELRREVGDPVVFGGQSWHADVTWMRPAGYASILHALEVPPVGGDTALANCIAGFEALSEGMKSQLRELKAMHAYHWSERIENPDFTVMQPVVRRHPVSGREGLYVNRMFTNRFEDMSVAESQSLLSYLCDHMERSEFTCRFRWAAGGVLIWDNRFTLHYPINDAISARRVMIRTTALEA